MPINDVYMIYNFNEIEAKWQKYWAEKQTFQADNNSTKPKYYVLDMFPYPSGAGLHVGASAWIYCIRYLCALQTSQRVQRFASTRL